MIIFSGDITYSMKLGDCDSIHFQRNTSESINVIVFPDTTKRMYNTYLYATRIHSADDLTSRVRFLNLSLSGRHIVRFPPIGTWFITGARIPFILPTAIQHATTTGLGAIWTTSLRNAHLSSLHVVIYSSCYPLTIGFFW